MFLEDQNQLPYGDRNAEVNKRIMKVDINTFKNVDVQTCKINKTIFFYHKYFFKNKCIIIFQLKVYEIVKKKKKKYSFIDFSSYSFFLNIYNYSGSSGPPLCPIITVMQPLSFRLVDLRDIISVWPKNPIHDQMIRTYIILFIS